MGGSLNTSTATWTLRCSSDKPKKEEDEDDQPEGLETGGLEEVPDEEESEDEDFEENEK